MPNDSSNARNWKPSTLSIHGRGRVPHAHYAVSTPIVHTSNFYFDTTAEVYEFMKAKGEGRVIREHEYGRYGNPTQQECERKLAAIEGAERAVLFSTGMAAVILTLMTYMKPDGHIIFTSDCYRQTRDFATNMLEKFGGRNPAEHQYHLYRIPDQSLPSLSRPRVGCKGCKTAQRHDHH